MKTPENIVQAMIDMVIGTVGNSPKMEHIPIAPSSEITFKIEEIHPLDAFYNPQHKVVVRKQIQKWKLDSVLSLEAEQLDVLQ